MAACFLIGFFYIWKQKEPRKGTRAMTILQKFLERERQGLDLRLWRSLWLAVGSLLRAGDLRAAYLGRHCERATTQKHRIKALDRLLGNPRLHRHLGRLYAGLARLLIRESQSVVVLVDWTQIDAQHHALVGAVPLGGRALPILCHVHAKAKVPSRAMHRRFLEELSQVLPKGCIPILVTDAGFQNTWVADVQKLGWHYVARLRHQTCVRKPGSNEWIPNKELHRSASTRPRSLGYFEVGKHVTRNRVVSRLVLARRPPKQRHRKGRCGKRLMGGGTNRLSKQHKEPWLLQTNLDCSAVNIINYYALRMQIEETFRDAKSRWKLDAVRSSMPQRIAVILLIASLGLFAVNLVGLAAEKQGLHRQLQANTTRRRVISHFLLGVLLVTTQTSLGAELLLDALPSHHDYCAIT